MNLLTLNPIATAITAGPGPATNFAGAPRNIVLQATFLYGAGGTSVDCYVQTSVDGGVSWFDIANFHFLVTAATALVNLVASTPKTTQVTPTMGTLASNTALDGLLGPMFRTYYKSSGTYSGVTSLLIDIATDSTPR